MRSKKAFIAVVLAAFLAGIVFTGGVLFASGNYWLDKVIGSQNSEPAPDGSSLRVLNQALSQVSLKKQGLRW
ncbi:hypothetical protein [Syntrophaceticus schinkii]|uniref:Uncharacterized protein n=1 Tax=Syntrophaceticus schinkii TaxID=499207 RepID=A0A0B7ME10_9FIRM|nr:hypothetical protein [Syntrophaceticus schinkii]CEO88285.1 exported hypothetical protein [Syntrophaceticus schinkii]